MSEQADASKRRKRIEALSRLDDLNPLWIEIKGLLDEEFEYALDIALDCESEGEKAAWHRGYAQAVKNVRDTFDDYRNVNRTLEQPGD